MESPFLNLHNQLQQKISGEVRQQPSTDELIIFCFTQVRLLHMLYVSMMQVTHADISSGEGNPEDFLFAIDKARFDYFSFISVLNQFGRILEDKYPNDIELRSYKRIRFFRNKVIEHWDDYTQIVGPVSFTLPKDRPSIPTLVTVTSPEERKKLKSEIDRELQAFDVVLNLEAPYALNCSGIASNVEKIYVALESIDPALGAKTKSGEYTISETIVTLLFKFGFPAPILDVKSYSEELVELIISKLNLPVPSSVE